MDDKTKKNIAVGTVVAAAFAALLGSGQAVASTKAGTVSKEALAKELDANQLNSQSISFMTDMTQQDTRR